MWYSQGLSMGSLGLLGPRVPLLPMPLSMGLEADSVAPPASPHMGYIQGGEGMGHSSSTHAAFKAVGGPSMQATMNAVPSLQATGPIQGPIAALSSVPGGEAVIQGVGHTRMEQAGVGDEAPHLLPLSLSPVSQVQVQVQPQVQSQVQPQVQPQAQVQWPALPQFLPQVQPPALSPALPQFEQKGVLMSAREELMAGIAAYNVGDSARAVEALKAAVRLDPSSADAWSALGHALHRTGEVDATILAFHEVVKVCPRYPQAYLYLGAAFHRGRHLRQAAQCYMAALRTDPLDADAHICLGQLMHEQGQLDQALVSYLEALAINLGSATAWGLLGSLGRARGSTPASVFVHPAVLSGVNPHVAGILARGAVGCYEEAIRLDPGAWDSLVNLGACHREAGRVDEALACMQRAAALRPEVGAVHSSLAQLCHERGWLDAAAASYRLALKLGPLSTSQQAQILNNLATVLDAQGVVGDAVKTYSLCLNVDPLNAYAWSNLGNILCRSRRLPEAASCFMKCLAVRPDFANVHVSLAAVLRDMGNRSASLHHLDQACSLAPTTMPEAFAHRGHVLLDLGHSRLAADNYWWALCLRENADGAHFLAVALKDSGHIDSAVSFLRRALELDPDHADALYTLVHTVNFIADWRDRTPLFARLERKVLDQLDAGALPSVQPFHLLSYPLDVGLALRLAHRYARHTQEMAFSLYPQGFVLDPHPSRSDLLHAFGGKQKRLKVGYVSSDFGNHPLSHLMQSVFALHDKCTVHVVCYALSPNDGSEWRRRIEANVEDFVDVSAMSVIATAQRIVADGVHVLINLNGYTKGARNEIFALRPAPIQVSYMGFPGTFGGDFIDYLVIDSVTSPPELEHLYSESLVRMPHSYFCNDHRQSSLDCLDPAMTMTRDQVKGLPPVPPDDPDHVLLCCFNQHYKMDPATFAAWAEILRRVPAAILWLLRFPPAGEVFLRAEWGRLGMEQERLVFTDTAPKGEHILRSALADLFLDTPMCNGHTTGCDVLWAGCPILTLTGTRMSSRVAASLVMSSGVSWARDMVVSDLREYVERAVQLASDPQRLRAMKQDLQFARHSSPLFDTPRWVSNFERALWRMWRHHEDERNGPPAGFSVLESDERPLERRSPASRGP